MRAALVIAIVAIGLVAMLRNRFAGLLLYTWFTFFRPLDWAYKMLVEYRPSMVVGLTLLTVSALCGVLPNVTTVLSAGSLAFLLWTVATAQWAYDVERAWQSIGNLAPAIIVASLGIAMTTTRKRFMWFIAVATGSLAVHGVWRALTQIASGGGQITDGIGGTFNDNNAFGLALVRVIFFVVALAQTFERRWLRLVAAASIPLLIAAVAFTFSRGAFLALFAGSVIFLALQPRKRFAVVAAAAGAVFFLAILPAGYTDRVSTITSYEEDGDRSALGRLHFWRVALEMARDRGVGVGLGNFEAAYDHYDFSDGAFGSRRAVHSTHLQALAETGWFGFVLFECLLLWNVYVALRMRQRSRQASADSPDQRLYVHYGNAIIAATVAFAVGGSFLGQLLSELNWFTFAWTASLDRLQRAELADHVSGEARLHDYGRAVKAVLP